MSIGLCKPAVMGLHLKAAGSGNPVGGAGEAGRSVGGGGAVGCGDAAVATGAWIATVGGISPAGSVDGISEQANNSGTKAIRTRRTGQTPRVIRIVSVWDALPGSSSRCPLQGALSRVRRRDEVLCEARGCSPSLSLRGAPSRSPERSEGEARGDVAIAPCK